MPRTYHRDTKGRFTKAQPSPMIDPKVLRELRAGWRPFEMNAEVPWVLEIQQRWTTYSTPSGDEPE